MAAIISRLFPLSMAYCLMKESHPDVSPLGEQEANEQAAALIHAYKVLVVKLSPKESHDDVGEELDPFGDPQSEADEVFVNELRCIGRGCPYSCVARAPLTFAFAEGTGAARAICQGEGGNSAYLLNLAVGQCPVSCIAWVTRAQNQVLTAQLRRAIDGKEAANDVGVVIDSLIAQANYENGRVRTPRRKPKSSTEWVDMF
eukprot:jgi/Mesvir1/25046/Mv18330-RA.1